MRWPILVAIVVAAMLAIELANSVRLLADPNVRRTFPHGYVSKGVYSAWAYLRPLDRTSTDFAGPLTGIHNVLYRKDDLYAGFRLEGSHGLRYPPSAILQILPFAMLADPPDLTRATQVVDLVGRLCVAATIVIAASFVRPAVGRRRDWIWIVLLLLGFYPLRWMLFCVQAQSLITLCVAVMILAYARSRTLLSGIMLGLAACMKPYLALLLVFAAVRGQWRLVLGAVATAGALIVASVAIAGLLPWRTYLFDMLPLMAMGYGSQANQSVNGIVHRWLGHTTFVLGPPSTAVMVASRLSAVAFTCLAAWPRRAGKAGSVEDAGRAAKRPALPSDAVRRERLSRAVDIGIATLAVTMASPIAWEHYYAWCIVLFAVLAAVYHLGGAPTRLGVALTCSYILVGTYWLPFRPPMSGPVTLIHSTHFFGAILLLGTAWAAQLWLRHEAVSGLSPVEAARGPC